MPATRKPRFPWWGWLPYVLLGVVVAGWALTHFGAVVSGAGSVRAWAFAAGAGLLTAALLYGVARLTRRGWAGQLAGFVPLVLATVVAVLPSYVTTQVNEAAPDGLIVAGPVPEATGTSGAPETTAAETTDAGTSEAETSEAATFEAPATTPAPEPAVPVQLGVADFGGIDHDAAGTASLIRLVDGSLLVRFEQFSVEPGPDYDVYVVSGPDVQVPEGTHLGDLKGTQGDQNYPVPADFPAPDGAVTVLIWCELFDVPVANATLEV